jgi:hypothetical protein
MASTNRSPGNVARVDPRSQRPANSEESAPETLVPDIVDMDLRQRASDGDANSSQRWARIQKRAYEIAQQRGFTAGAELDDWLQAESEIDASAGAMSPGEQFTG